jgi:hypothetical protein
MRQAMAQATASLCSAPSMAFAPSLTVPGVVIRIGAST